MTDQLTVGRLTLWEGPAIPVRSSGRSGYRPTVTFTGQDGSPPGTLARLAALREDLELLAGQDEVVPIVPTRKGAVAGFYRITDAGAEVRRHQTTEVLDWSVSAELVSRGGPAGELRSSLIGADRTNTHPSTSGGGTPWHAPSSGAALWTQGATTPSTLDRTSAGGLVTVRRNLDDGAEPSWTVAPSGYYAGAAYVESAGVVRHAEGIAADVADWELGNGLVRLAAVSGAAATFSGYDGTDYESARRIRYLIAGVDQGAPTGVVVLRNAAHAASVRLLWPRGAVDLTVRRGAFHVAVTARSQVAAVLTVQVEDSDTGTSDLGGAITRSANDTDGNRWVLGTAGTVTPNTGGGWTGLDSPSGLEWSMFAGHELAGSGAASGNDALDLLAQWIADRAELVRGATR